MLSLVTSVKASDLRSGMMIVTAFGDRPWSPSQDFGPWVTDTALVRVPVADLGMGVL